ncbi:ABC transporter ATP-binding protein [Corynebacterium pygosceleis]|uniref:ABC transporter ATP-binding protein n=1 Tax=Corynebacterium pygosceleis TaxID=2800406 RepID=UPI002004FBDE|nr:ABC transporter ATP-binding protein [Corynebacterium pygosceleis]MCK7675268.1 ABC transporter ATP-binding protein [Corynebacterium pygosceleis]
MTIAASTTGLNVTVGHTTILNDLELEVASGSFHGILGSNGAGKTTLFKTLLGFIQKTGGSVRLLGTDPWPRNANLLRRVGIQHQRPAFFVRMSLIEHLRAVADIFGSDRTYVSTVIDALNLGKVADTKCENLSGGERQRLAVASALVHRPEVLFLDEPTAGLDPAARKSLVDLLRDTDFTDELTVLYTTHYLEEAERLCDVVSIMDSGTIIATGSPRSLISTAELGATVLLPAAVPQTATIQGIFDRVELSDDGILVHTEDAARALVTLSGAGVDCAGAQISQGRLEDVFFKLTGRNIEQ